MGGNMNTSTAFKRFHLLVAFCLTASFGVLNAQTITSNGSGGGNWNSASTWNGGVVPTSANDVVIAGGDSVYIYTGTAVTCNSLTIQSNAKFKNGDSTGFAVTSALTAQAGSYYYDGNNAVSWPTAGSYSIDSASNFIQTSNGSSTIGASGNATYGNLTILKSGTTCGANLAINGNLTVNTGGSGNTFRGTNTAAGSLTHHVAGNVKVVSGQWSCIDVGGAAITCIWNVDGNVTVGDPSTSSAQSRMGPFTSGSSAGLAIFNIGGNLSFVNGARIQGGSSSTAGTGAGEINLKGNLSIDNTCSQNTSNKIGSFSINFFGTGTQTVSLGIPLAGLAYTANDTIAAGASVVFAGGSRYWGLGGTGSPAGSFVVNGSLNFGADTLKGTQNFVTGSGATLATSDSNGFDVVLAVTGTKTFSSVTSFDFSGTSAQLTGTSLPATFNNLTINNAAGVTLSKSVNVQGVLTLTSGNLQLDTNYIMASSISGASSSSYILTDSSKSSLKITGVGSTKVLFPVGTTAEGYSPVWMTNAGTADTFSVAAMMDTSAALGGGRVNVKWNIAENNPGSANLTLTFGWMGTAQNSLFAATPSLYTQIYNLGGILRQAGAGNYSSQLTTEPYTLGRSGIVSLGTFGVGKFLLNVTLQVGDYGSVASGNWSSLATWKQWDGTGWNTVPTVIPAGEVNVYINKGDTVTVDSKDSVGNSLTVNGYLKDVAGLITSGATVVFDSASTYELAYNGATGVPGIPNATWNKGSTCLITGNNGTISSTTGYNANQNFYNLTINAGFTSNKDIAMYDNTIGGNLVINNTGSSRIQLTSPGAGTPNTITIKGNLILTAGQFSTNGSGSAADITINSYGNIIATGGNFSVSRGSGPNVQWNAYGDSLVLSGVTTQTSSSIAKMVFAKQGTQYVSFENVTWGGGGLPAEVDTGTTLVMGTSSFEGNGAFTADSGATLVLGDTTGLNGNVATSGPVTLSSGASFTFNGAVAQTTGSLLSGTFRNLTVNNSKGVVLTKNVNLTGALTLTSGILAIDTNAVTAATVAGGSSSSYVSTDSSRGHLMISNVGSSKVLFPVGTALEGYSPVWMTNSGTADSYTVNAAKDTSTVQGKGRVNVRWTVGEGTAGGSSLTMQFGWMRSAENAAFPSDSANAGIFYLSDTTEAGSGAYVRQSTTEPYTISRGGISAVGTFAVGNFISTGVNEAENVPVQFKLFQNYPNPFNPSTKILFSVAKKGETSLRIYNILGQQVETLFSGEAQPGKRYVVEFNGASLSSGVYFSVLQSGGQRQIQKMVLMK